MQVDYHDHTAYRKKGNISILVNKVCQTDELPNGSIRTARRQSDMAQCTMTWPVLQ